VSEFDFGSLLKEEPKLETLKEPTKPKPELKPTPTQKVAPKPTPLEQRLEALETQLSLQQVAFQLDLEGGVLGLLFKELKATLAQENFKFKPRDFRNVQRLAGFQVVWDWCLKERIIIPENKLTEEEITRLEALTGEKHAKTTGGRYVCDYARLP